MGSQRERSSQRSRVTEMEEDDLSSDRKATITEIVMYILAKEAMKFPAKKLPLLKIAPRYSKNFKAIMLEVKEILSQVFWYDLIDADGKYFVINKFTSTNQSLQILREPIEHKVRYALLLLVLCVVFMEGGSVREDTIWNFLELLKIKVGNVADAVYGDVKKIVSKDFVNMLYLQHNRREGTDPPVFEFSMGIRAEAEIPKRKLLKFVCKVYGNREHDWPVQMKEVEDSEGQEAQHLSQLISKRMRLSQSLPASSQSSRASSSQR